MNQIVGPRAGYKIVQYCILLVNSNFMDSISILDTRIVDLRYSYVLCTVKPMNYDGSSHEYKGFLGTFDPITKSIVLHQIGSTDVIKSVLIMGWVIKDVTALVTTNGLTKSEVKLMIEKNHKKILAEHPYFVESNCENSSKEVYEWLVKNRIPASLGSNGDIDIADCIRIKPPYDKESNYICPNRIILSRVMKLVNRINKPMDDC